MKLGKLNRPLLDDLYILYIPSFSVPFFNPVKRDRNACRDMKSPRT